MVRLGWVIPYFCRGYTQFSVVIDEITQSRAPLDRPSSRHRCVGLSEGRCRRRLLSTFATERAHSCVRSRSALRSFRAKLESGHNLAVS